jgi:hypothetical protein
VKGFRLQGSHLLAGGLLALLFVGALLLTGPGKGESEGGTRGVPSTYSDAPEGLRALLLTCGELGIPASRWTRSLELLGAGPPALVLIAGDERIPDLAPVRAWVEGGGRLLIGDTAVARPGRLRRTLFEAFDLAVRPSPGGRAVLEPEVEGDGFPPGLFPPARVFDRAPGSDPLATVSGDADPAPWIVSIPLGRGEVIAVADGSFLTNDRLLASPACPVLAVRLLERVSRGEAVAFCESVHGYLEGGSPLGVVWAVLRSTPPGHFALQAGAAASLLLIAGARRFGRVRRAAEAPRRSEYEHVDAVARLLRRSGAWREVATLLAEGVRRRLDLPPSPRPPRPGGAPSDDLETKVASLASSGDPRRILAALDEIERVPGAAPEGGLASR